MSDILDKIDHDLIELEERLLLELRQLRKLHSDQLYSPLEEDSKLELSLTRDTLAETLEHSGDRQNLSLKTTRHEQLTYRLQVLGTLLRRKIPTAFIESAHEEVKAARQKTELQVLRARELNKGAPGSSSSRALFDRAPTIGEDARNPKQVTIEEQQAFDDGEIHKDGGVYTAARELSILDDQVRQHYIDGRSIEDVLKDRAQFSSRELKRGHEADRDGKGKIAQSPEEIRRKLADRCSQVSGASTFAARDVSHSSDIQPTRPRSAPEKPAASKDPIAQSPEEIRRKLAARQSSQTGTKASFGAKDIEPAHPQEFKSRRPERKTEEEKPQKPSGKAVFESRDLSKPKP